MCGINGFNWSDISQIQSMNYTIRHRGPDDEGIFVDENISLGHVRLSIFQELKEELLEKGHIFKSKTDTELIIHAYEEYGFNCINKFNGMWGQNYGDVFQ